MGRSRFNLTRSGQGPLAFNGVGQRFGKGLYFSSASSKSNDYAAGSERCAHGVGSGAHAGATATRCVFLCKVVEGRRHTCLSGLRGLSGAEVAAAVEPEGSCRSVYGADRTDGGDLTYDELVVYETAAAVPSYLIVYQF